jgi:hypothetical protein
VKTVDKTQLEKRVDALEARGGGDGVGRNVGQHNEIFNVNKGEPDSNTISLTSGDQNTARGKDNQMRGIAYQCEMTGLNNKMLGWNYYCIVGGTQNQLGADDDSARHYSVIMYGYQNVFTGFMEYSFINGDSNRGAGANVFNSIISGNQNVVVTEGIYDSVLIGQQNRVNDVRRSFVGGSQNYVEDAVDSIIVGLNNQVIQPQYAIVCGQGANGNIANMYIVAGSVFTVDRYGAVKAAGGYSSMGADYAEMFEWADGNPQNEDRRGMLVALSGDKIIPAHGDDFIGIISANPSVIGNNPLHWHKKYKTDVFGSVIYDDNGDAMLSDDYDPKREYIPRSERPEWAAVGLTGRLVVTDDGSCVPGAFVSARQGTATKCYKNTGARVLRRINETHVEVLLK